MNNKLLKRIPILIFGAMFLGSCGDFIDNMVTTELVNEDDTRACITYQGGKVSERQYCDEKRDYPAQVKNVDADRFDNNSYTGVVGSGLEGAWLVISDIPPLGKARSVCDLTASSSSHDFELHCKDGFIDKTIDQNANQLASTTDITQTTTTTAPNGDTVKVQWDYTGTIINNGLINGQITGIKEVNGGTAEPFTDIDFNMVRIGDVGTKIGSFSAERLAHGSGTVEASVNHDIYYFSEYQNFVGLMAFDNTATDPVVYVATGFTPDDKLIKKDYTVNNNGLVFTNQEQVLDVAGTINQTESWKKQKTRQLDFTKLNAQEIDIYFLSNRHQSERFERPDTEANLNISF